MVWPMPILVQFISRWCIILLSSHFPSRCFFSLSQLFRFTLTRYNRVIRTCSFCEAAYLIFVEMSSVLVPCTVEGSSLAVVWTFCHCFGYVGGFCFTFLYEDWSWHSAAGDLCGLVFSLLLIPKWLGIRTMVMFFPLLCWAIQGLWWEQLAWMYTLLVVVMWQHRVNPWRLRCGRLLGCALLRRIKSLVLADCHNYFP